ncbi:MAG TPA: hypothetical protein VMH89_03260 [Candidatus Acidoferrum sp.]|nr:hypothetical protein [Candidatus Acidoferrum sp.]
MPRLALITVCDRVIIDEVGVASLIGLFNRIMPVIPPGVEVPSNAIAPKEWALFAIWEYEPGDENREFTMTYAVRFPDGSMFNESQVNFRLDQNRNQQIRVPFVGFPIGQLGLYQVHIRLLAGDVIIQEPRPLTIELQIQQG